MERLSPKSIELTANLIKQLKNVKGASISLEVGEQLIDTIEAQQQEIEQLRAQVDKCHACEISVENEEMGIVFGEMSGTLEKARDVIISSFRENPSQENMEYAEYVLSEIDKMLVGGEE